MLLSFTLSLVGLVIIVRSCVSVTATQPIFAAGWQPSVVPVTGYATGTVNPGLKSDL